jgi:Sec-independent protein translocase protein TatA
MSNNEMLLVGSLLFVAYLAYGNSKLNKKISDLQREISVMKKANEAELSQEKSVNKSASKLAQNSINEQPQTRARLNEMPLYTRY